MADREGENRDDPAWVADRLATLDKLYDDARNRGVIFGEGAAAFVVPQPDTKGAVVASQHAAELRGLLGAAKRAPLERGKGVEDLPAPGPERVSAIRAAIAELQVELAKAAAEGVSH